VIQGITIAGHFIITYKNGDRAFLHLVDESFPVLDKDLRVKRQVLHKNV
jgi:hypothetical protein